MKTRAKPAADRVYGLSAALATFEQRPESVLSIAHTKEVRRALAGLLREAARRRIAYREVDAEALARMAESVHHEGVCLLVRPRANPTAERIAERLGERGLIAALDGVENPHNVGAILRSAAFFGVHALVYAGAPERALPPAARLVAQGGAEHVLQSRVPALLPALRSLVDRGIAIIGSDARAKRALGELRWPARAVLVLGHEQRGLSPEVRKACGSLVRIAGVAAVESLNVSVAAGIFFASYAAEHGLPQRGAEAHGA